MTLQLKNISVVYRDGDHGIQALDDVSLEIMSGQCFALVGESGSGKTTLGKMCLGLLPENAEKRGHIYLQGRPINYHDEKSLNQIRWKRMSMVFQDGTVNLNPAHRIIDQVAEPIIQHEGLNREESIKRAAWFLEQLGILREEHRRYPHQLSGGQIQKVLLSMAMILDPDVIILDEPTSALDALTKGLVSEIIQEAKTNGKCLLLITHDLEFAVQNAETMAVLYLGQIMEILPTNEMFSNPSHPYTKALARSYPAIETTRDLGGIRGDAFYRLVHHHGERNQKNHRHIQGAKSFETNGHAPSSGCLFHDRCTQTIEQCKLRDVSLEKIDNHMVRCLRRGIVNILEIKAVAKRYGKVVALESIDLTVKAGELFSIVGETGSGKTTLGMIAAGVMKQDKGKRAFGGQDMDHWMKKDYKTMASQIGVIYQNPAESISHRFSVYEAVAEPLKIHHIGKNHEERESLVKSVLADVHLPTDDVFLRRYPHELNLGALQRICIARALVLSPSIVIADEPTSSLDPSIQAKVLKLLLDLQIEKGLTMFFISHDIGLARKISDRIGVMLQGHVVELGSASQIFAYPRHPYTQILIESVGGKLKKGRKNIPGKASQNGCPFISRCIKREDICERKKPPLRLIDQRQVACHFPF